jgi:eukaryotic-like serine/threonine-protein kinase
MPADANGPQLEAGARIGDRYTVVAPISAGAMGAVYRARDEDGAEVAVKQLIDETQAARFEIESRLLTRLRHPRVVRVLEHLEDGSGRFLVMELVEGSDLGRMIDECGGGLPADDALAWARQACEALQYVHAQNIVHRDVKPQNLIAGGDGVVLVDFGIARQVDSGDAGTRAIGTPRYMAPEILVGEATSPRSDVYSLAATVWTLLAGKPPSYRDPTVLSETVPGVDPGVEQTLRAGLEMQPERRIASVEAFAAALGAPLGESAGESLARSLPRERSQRSLLEAIVKAAAGVFEAAAASVALSDEPTGELVYQAAWGAGADEIVGVRLPAGAGIAGAVVSSREGIAVPECRSDPRFAAQVAAGTGYVPHTMLVAPLQAGDRTVGTLSILDRRDGGAYGPADLPRAALFAELTMAALESRE